MTRLQYTRQQSGLVERAQNQGWGTLRHLLVSFLALLLACCMP